MARLLFAGVRKQYGSIAALRGVDLEVADGELLVLVGPSGSGKSTALRLAAGLEQVTEGTIQIGARDVTALPPGKRNVSMVFQSYALFPHLTVAENIGFGLRARGVGKADAAERVREAARLAGCDRLFGRKPFELSGGERQRVALARALAGRPDVFLLDEPLSNLDAQLRVETRAELKRLHTRLETTTVYVTHDQIEALTMGDRVAVLNDGAIEQVGTPDEIYARPENRFVARFMGSPAMNILPAVLDGQAVRAGPFTAELPSGGAGLGGLRLELGVRPEHVRLERDGGFPAQVEVVETAGSEAFLHLAAEGQTFVARVAAGVRPTVGETVHVRAAASDTYLFDAESGATLGVAGA